jgi:methyl halide transferase
VKNEQLTGSWWNDLYLQHDTGWDIGYVSPPLRDYFNQLTDKSIEILIPGCGNGWEAEHLFRNGFQNIYVIDFSDQAIQNLKKRLPGLPDDHFLNIDFFSHQGKYDLIVEQTFFCALHPDQREEYAVQMTKLLKPEGKLVGLLFNDALNEDKPPFGGNEQVYHSLFGEHFIIKEMSNAYNSILPRKNRELFFIMTQK